MKQWVKFLPLFFLSIFVSCGSVSQYNTRSRTPSYVEVKNNGWSDIVIYEVLDGSSDRIRVVSVGAFRTERHILYNMGTSDMFFLIHNIGGQDYVIPFPWSYQAGTRIELTVENNVALSSFSVWPLDK